MSRVSFPQRTKSLLLSTGLLLGLPSWANDLDEYDLLKAGRTASQAEVGEVYQFRIGDLTPAQLAYGPREVKERAEKFLEKSEKKQVAYLIKKIKQVVIGPEGKVYLVDGHHLAKLLEVAKYPVLLAEVVAVKTNLSEEEFFTWLQKKKFVYLWDVVNERPIAFQDLPRSISDLKRDPYRDIPWALQDLGDIDEPTRPFAEFEWSKHLFRKHFTPEEVQKDWDGVLKRARTLSHGPEAKELSRRGLIDGYRKDCREYLE